MSEKILFRSAAALAALTLFASVAGADTFGTGVNAFDIDFVLSEQEISALEKAP